MVKFVNWCCKNSDHRCMFLLFKLMEGSSSTYIAWWFRSISSVLFPGVLWKTSLSWLIWGKSDQKLQTRYSRVEVVHRRNSFFNLWSLNSFTCHAHVIMSFLFSVCLPPLQGKRICSWNQPSDGSYSSIYNVEQQVIRTMYKGFQSPTANEITTPDPAIASVMSISGSSSVLTDISNIPRECNSIKSKVGPVTYDNSISTTPSVYLNSNNITQRSQTSRTSQVVNEVSTNLLKRINELTNDGKYEQLFMSFYAMIHYGISSFHFGFQ